METFFKLFFLSLLSCTDAEPLQESGYGLNGGVQVTACSVRGARCEGAAVVAEWVLVLNSCIVAQNIEHIYVQKGIVDCTQGFLSKIINNKYVILLFCHNLTQLNILRSKLALKKSQGRSESIKVFRFNKRLHDCKEVEMYVIERTTPAMGTSGESSVRSVVALYSHPRAPGVDLALLRVDWPYEDQIDNRTLPAKTFDMLDKWMEDLLLSTTVNTYMLDETDNYIQMPSHPIKMFFVAVILPAVSFIIFFLFIVFFTGSTNTSRIPYKTLINSQESKSNV